MKAGWQLKALRDVCTVANGGTPKSGIAAYWGGEVNWLTPKDMGQMTGRHIANTPRKISEQGLDNCSASLVPPNSVILSTRAPIGHLAINDVPMAFNQGCRGLVPSDTLDPIYLFHFLSSSKEELNELGTGATFKELSSGALKDFCIPLPPLEEQQRIVALIDEALEGLARARANVEVNLRNARELFDNFTTSVFLDAQSKYAEATLGEICRFITDGTHQTPTYHEAGVTFLSAKNVKNGRIDWADVKFIDETQHLAMHKRLAPSVGDLLIRKNGAGYGGAALVDRDVVFDVYVSLAVLRPENWVLPEFLLQFANSSFGQSQFKDRIKGQGVPNLHLQEIRQVRLAVPNDINIQREIAERIQNALEATRDLEVQLSRKIQDLDDLRQSLLQKAFSGELT